MSVSMLCRTRRADHPYTVRCIGLRIWSVEELLYFMQHNLILLDESILNEELVLWLKDELHLRRLAMGLTQLLAGGCSVRAFILPIFREIGYPGPEAAQEVERELAALDALPITVRMKQKGDALIGHGKYVHAIESYRALLALREEATLDAEVLGAVHCNIGCAHARLFQLDEACEHLAQGARMLGTDEARRQYLCAVYLRDGRDGLAKAGEKIGYDAAACTEIEREITAIPAGEIPADIHEAVAAIAADCHRQMGM